MNTDYHNRADAAVRAAGLPGDVEISYKSVFGAVAAYTGGRIFLTCGKFGLGLKLDGETCADLIAAKAGAPLKYFEKGHVKRGYVVLAEVVLADPARLRTLIRQSVKFAASTPSP
jgi:TfoX/Sxy family transcriptional regulator of competence genes